MYFIVASILKRQSLSYGDNHFSYNNKVNYTSIQTAINKCLALSHKEDSWIGQRGDKIKQICLRIEIEEEIEEGVEIETSNIKTDLIQAECRQTCICFLLLHMNKLRIK